MRTVALIILLVTGVSIHAQPGPPWHRSVERVEQLRKVRLVETLGLGEEQSVRFFARLREHEAGVGALMREKNELLDRLDRLVRNEVPAEELEEVFPEVLAVDARVQEERMRFFRSLSDLLDSSQRARFLLFERQFDRELREAMRQVQRRRRAPERE